MVRQLPSNLCYLLHRLSETGRSFIELYGHKEKRMKAIVGQLREASKGVQQLQKRTETAVMIATLLGGLLLVFLAVVSLGYGLLKGAATMAILGGTAVFVGYAALMEISVITAQPMKTITTVEQLVKEFMTLVELHMDVLEEMNMVSEALEENSSSLMTTTAVQAKTTLAKIRQLPQFLPEIAELVERSRRVLDRMMQRNARELFDSIMNPTPEQDAMLIRGVTNSALLCEMTLNEFVKMRNRLKDFEEVQTGSEC